MSNTIRTAVLTISDTASQDASADRSGPTIKEILGNKPGFVCNEHLIVSDDILEIQKVVKRWSLTGEVDWIITTGGTGFGVRDRTPEAISPLLEREASGLVHLLLSSSIQHTPLAALSRPVAGTIRNTLVVTLPGSVKAVKENLDALFAGGVVEHALDLIKGGSGKQVHAVLAAQGEGSSSVQMSGGGHYHHHHHHHHEHEHHGPQPRSTLSHDPTAPVSARHRKSPYPIISLEEALKQIEQQIVPLEVQTIKVSSALRNYVLAVDVHAPQNIPSTSTTNVDGYAVRSTDPPGIYKVVTPQNHSLSKEVPLGTIYRINTGAPLPAGTDAVIMVEDTRLVSTFESGDGEEGEEKEVETLAQVPGGENVRSPGSDVKKGDLVLTNGDIIRSGGGEIGTLAFVGCKEVQVVKRPVVAILSTGNEIVDLQSSQSAAGGEEWGGIYDTNRPSLQAALEGFGYEVVDLGVVHDSIEAHVSAIQRGLDEADLILTTGGTSMGPSDLLKPIIERNFGGTIHFGRVSIKPGKPTTFATMPVGSKAKPVFALPGNPASALVTFHVFVLPALRQLGGWGVDLCRLPRVLVEIQVPMNLDPRNEFHRVRITSSGGKLKAFSTGGQRSSRVASLYGANGLVLLPMKVDGGPTRLEAGSTVDALLIGELETV